MDTRPFLTARWEQLVLLNYSVEHALLDPRVPRGTELDLWNGVPYVSLVGFRFTGTRVRGIEPGSEAEFMTHRGWGYTRQRDGGTLEYEVEHSHWRIWHPT
ncbi:MAG TPA: DUF2071 domain-containing protein, partial [Candidatus Polarisedimenticolaceae bacterium]|nr:DUF2071 domain-containing protein [Candidatus Polarisedimenticolaceae bacterium]